MCALPISPHKSISHEASNPVSKIDSSGPSPGTLPTGSWPFSLRRFSVAIADAVACGSSRPSTASRLARASRNRADASARSLLPRRSEEHTSELQSRMRNSYAVFCLKKKKATSGKEQELRLRAEVDRDDSP